MSGRPTRLLASLRMMRAGRGRLGRQLSGALDVLARYAATPFAAPNEESILVLGNPKSGTTAIAALLAAHGDLSVTLDFWPRLRRPETLAAVHAGTLPFDAFVRRFRADFARDVVKDPVLTFLYPRLAARFPRARFVMVVRDPRANIRSILNRLDLPGDLADIGPREYGRMRPLWEAMIESPWLEVGDGGYVEKLAWRWALGARVYLEHEAEMSLIRYEDFEADKAGAIGRLAEELGLAHRRDIADAVDRRFQPAGDRKVGWLEFFGGANLESIERICGAEARALGYPVPGER